MKKNVFVFLFVGVVTLTVFAQTSTTVTNWLNQALAKSNYALRLARNSNIELTIDQINAANQEVLDYMLKIENWANQGNTFTSNQLSKWQQIVANEQEINRKLLNFMQRYQ